MSETGKRIEQLGITLPVRSRKGTGAVDAVLKDDMLYLSAHLPVDVNGNPVYTGKVGEELDVETAYKAARLWTGKQCRGFFQAACSHERVFGLNGRSVRKKGSACPIGHGSLCSSGKCTGSCGSNCPHQEIRQGGASSGSY